MKHILIPVDMSDNTERQIDYLLKRLRPKKALVTLLHVYEPVYEHTFYADLEEEGPDLAPKQTTLNELADRINKELPDLVVQTSIQIGLASDILRYLMREEHFDTVLLGTHRHGPLHDMFVGSVAAEVIKSARCPVHVVPASKISETNDYSLLVAIDIWSTEVTEVIRQATEIAIEAGIPRVALSYVELPETTEVYREWVLIRESKEVRRSDLYAKIDELINAAFPDGVSGVEITKTVTFGDPVVQLRKQLAVNKPFAAVIGAHRHGPMHDLILGSVSRKLIKKAEVPIILMPGKVKDTPASGTSPALTGSQQVDLMRHFPGMDRSHRDRLLSHSERVSFEPGTVILKRGEPATTFYLLLSGSVDLMSRLEGQEELKIQTLETGDLFGFSCVCPTPFWTLDAVAGSACEVIAFDATAVLKDCGKEAGFAVQVLQTFCGLILARLNAMRDQVSVNASPDWEIATKAPAEVVNS